MHAPEMAGNNIMTILRANSEKNGSESSSEAARAGSEAEEDRACRGKSALEDRGESVNGPKEEFRPVGEWSMAVASSEKRAHSPMRHGLLLRTRSSKGVMDALPPAGTR